MTQALQGEVIPLLQAGVDLTLRQIHMVNELSGWGIGVTGSDTEHLLRTKDGGISWQDVTPPQPLGEYTYNIYTGYADENTAWAIYYGSDLIWSTHDGGITWGVVPLEFSTMGGGMFTVLDKDHAWLLQFQDAGMQKVYTVSYRTTDGGETWIKLLDPYEDVSIQGFDKTGYMFGNPNDGWLTRDLRGVVPQMYVNVTEDGGFTWYTKEIPPPPSYPDIFKSSACGLYDPLVLVHNLYFVRLTCVSYENDQSIERNFFYTPDEGHWSWIILDAPIGEFYYISIFDIYAIGREIYRSEDGGYDWELIRTVNWDGQFSFIDKDTAWAVAHDPVDDEYALVKTTDGCNSFSLIDPEVITSPVNR
jgi:hypothetical protein